MIIWKNISVWCRVNAYIHICLCHHIGLASVCFLLRISLLSHYSDVTLGSWSLIYPSTQLVEANNKEKKRWWLKFWVWILNSAEEDDLSPSDSNIACQCQGIEINNNKQCALPHCNISDNLQLNWLKLTTKKKNKCCLMGIFCEYIVTIRFPRKWSFMPQRVYISWRNREHNVGH